VGTSMDGVRDVMTGKGCYWMMNRKTLMVSLTTLALLLASAAYAQTNILGEAIMGITKPLSDGLKQDIFTAMDAELRQEIYQYQGIDVRFTHQRWKVNQKSVCSNHQLDSRKVSLCTKAALSLFKRGCSQFQTKRYRTSVDESEMRMYCQAASSYRPMIIQASSIRSESSDMPKSKRSKLCNQLIAESIGEASSDLISRRNKECGAK